MQLNWHNQGADAGLYSNDDIHAVRILAMEPTTDRKGTDSGRHFWNHAKERLRVLGEIPLRKFIREGEAPAEPGDKEDLAGPVRRGPRPPKLDPTGQPLDPDGNPDSSFLAKLPAD